MPHVIICFRVAAIGPSDTENDVQAIRNAVRDLSEEFKHRHVSLSFHHWSELAPGLGAPQEYIDEHIHWNSVDFVVGLMASRFGRAGNSGESGTEHECRQIIGLHTKRKQPDLLFYFKTIDENAITDPDEYKKVLAFRTELQVKGLTSQYRDTADLETIIKPALRAKIEGKLRLQRVTQRRIGELPPNRTISVEMIVLSELKEDHVAPTILILKNARDELFVFDGRYMAAQDLIDWVVHSMGFTKSTGAPLGEILARSNIDNIKNNTGIIQLWMGNVLIMDHPGFEMKDIKILLGQTNVKDGKLGFDLTKKEIRITRPVPKLVKDDTGKWLITL